MHTFWLLSLHYFLHYLDEYLYNFDNWTENQLLASPTIKSKRFKFKKRTSYFWVASPWHVSKLFSNQNLYRCRFHDLLNHSTVPNQVVCVHHWKTTKIVNYSFRDCERVIVIKVRPFSFQIYKNSNFSNCKNLNSPFF